MKSLLFLFLLSIASPFSWGGEAERDAMRDEVADAFTHAYDGYNRFASSHDELLPLSCTGKDTYGNYALTLIDSLDSLAVFHNATEFTRVALLIIAKFDDFDIDRSVSLFETNIRLVGALISSHLIAKDTTTSIAPQGQPFQSAWQGPPYSDELLRLAERLGRRLLPAFDTPTGLPFGSINLRKGVNPAETSITSLAVAGTIALEFGMLTRLTGDPIFDQVARKATLGLWDYRSKIDLLGNHIDVKTGTWTQSESGIGSNADSYYEYLLKAGLLFNDASYISIFSKAYSALRKHLKVGPWYTDVNMVKGNLAWPYFQALQAFFPGLQVLAGDIQEARETITAFHRIWQRYGALPEGFNLGTGQLAIGREQYPLRPEMAESLWYLFKATRDPLFLSMGRDMVVSLRKTRTKCGYASIRHVGHFVLEDRQESFLLSETFKYLYLLFDQDNWINQGSYIFNTEGHPIPMRSEWYRSETTPVPPSWDHRGRSVLYGFVQAVASKAEKFDGQWTCKVSSLLDRLSVSGLVWREKTAGSNDHIAACSAPPPVAEQVAQESSSVGKACLTIKDGYWSYEVCAGDVVRQIHHESSKAVTVNVIGRFQSMESVEGGWDEHYDQGDRCDAALGKPRSGVVHFKCGKTSRLVKVQEPKHCTYILTVTTPDACDL